MKLKKLKLLSKFRGLPSGYEIDFSIKKNIEHSVEPICFIGLNGSGKSNILEVISEIFYYLEGYAKTDEKNVNQFKTVFGFQIEYSLPKMTVDDTGFSIGDLSGISIEDLGQHKHILISKKKNELPIIKISFGENNTKLNISKNEQLSAVLPRYIIGYSSGMNELLSNPFIKMDFDYFKELKQKTNQALRSTLEINRLFYLNYLSSKLVAISNFIFELEAINPIKEELKLISLKSFSIKLKLSKLKDKKDYLPSELNLAINSFQKIDQLFLKNEITNQKFKDKIEFEFNFDINKDTKRAFINEFKTPYSLFRILYNFQMLNLELVGFNTRKKVMDSNSISKDNLSDLIPKKEKEKLIFSVDNIAFEKKGVTDNVYFKQLSDGEHQLLQVLGSVALLESKSTLFLFDEPTTHFNPEWRSKFIFLLNQCTNNIEREQDILITTHSPFIVSDSKRENVIRTLNGEKKTYEIPEDETYGASIRFLLSKLFNQKKSIGEYSYQELQKLYDKVEAIENEEDIQFIKDESMKFGDSPEKIMLFHLLNEKIKKL